MSVFRKLLLASALVATGLGVAIFLGGPGAVSQTLHPILSNASASFTSRSAEIPEISGSTARLVPEPVATEQPGSGHDDPRTTQSPSRLAPIDSLSAGTALAAVQPPSAAETSVPNNISHHFNGEPSVARLRNEAPRPVGNEPRSPATIRREPQLLERANNVGPAADDAYQVASNFPATPVVPTSFSPSSALNSPQPAAYDVPFRSPEPAGISPPPWALLDEEVGPRMHVVVDGDSLAKLAGRYLNDPQRSAEIYEMNRELLSNPDLLPIGVELKIPDRTPQTSWNGQSRRAPLNADVRQATQSHLVPIRSMKFDDSIIPQAQLSQPIRAD